jgi:predicted amino acid-binding ACT domain protein
MTMVLDNLRWTTASGQLVIPPFHTGHLSFIPETDVTVSLLRDKPAPEHGCEICVTPFDAEPHTLFTMKCVMVDRPGVVEKLIKAVASLKINIVTQESSSIDDLSRHEVFMLLDWSTTDMLTREPIQTDLRNRFTDLHAILQTNDARFLRLLERILALCGDILDWSSTDPSVPNIQMHPLEERRDAIRRSHSRVKRDPARKLHVSVSLPEDILRRIEDGTGWLSHEPLPYVIMSDTDSRTLRVFFPKRGKELR